MDFSATPSKWCVYQFRHDRIRLLIRFALFCFARHVGLLFYLGISFWEGVVGLFLVSAVLEAAGAGAAAPEAAGAGAAAPEAAGADGAAAGADGAAAGADTSAGTEDSVPSTPPLSLAWRAL